MAADFTTSFMEDGITILIPKPKEKINIFGILNPFDWSLWLAICASLMISSTIIWFCSYVSPLSAWNRNLPEAIADEVSWIENVWSCVGSITLQGVDFYPSALSSRTVIGFFWIFSVIVQNTYQADMTAILTKVNFEPTISRLSDFVTTQYLKPNIYWNTNTLDLFRNATPGTVYADVWKILENQPKIYTDEEAIHLVSGTREYGVIGDTSTLRYFAIANCSIFQMTNDFFNIASFAFAIPKRAVYRKAVNF
ncbi:hypothetical protein Ciccas_002498 [Cichlidogyrus casuarinus]|uniref:Ionotropic glutamate receptor C-terminal domain-containing protein n=1 Tax=Cichlidogyrus casuarinus TaxID=1844966 RepID=A0ABD2QI38_9PLAT